MAADSGTVWLLVLTGSDQTLAAEPGFYIDPPRHDVLLVMIPSTSDRKEEQGERIHRQIIPGWKSAGQNNHLKRAMDPSVSVPSGA